MLAFNHPELPQPRQTINGKLVVQDPNQFDYINLQMESFAQQLEEIELQVVTAQQQDRREYINQLKILKGSVQNLERSYRQLLSATIVAAVIFAILLFYFGVSRQPSYHKSQPHNPISAWPN